MPCICHRRPALRSVPTATVTAAALLAGLVLLTGAPGAWAQDSDGAVQREQARLQLKQLRHEREQLRLNLEAYQSSETKTLEQIEALSADVRAAKQRERELRKRREQLIAERDRRAQELRELRGQIAATQARISGNLVNVYRLSKVADAASLITVGDYRTYFKDSRYLALLQEVDRQALTELEALKAELVEAQQGAQANLDELAAVMESLVAEQVQLTESERVLRDSLEEIRRNRELSRGYLGELDETVEEMEVALVALEQAPATRSLNTLPPPARLKGELPPPASGEVIALFGHQDPRYALKKFQRGIVLDVPERATVRAVAAGRVVHAGPFRGYQELVVLEHGHGLFTVYGHLEGVKLEKGAWVDAEGPLGRSAYQPAEGTHNLYFEVRLRGDAVDPLEWLRPNSLPVAEIARNPPEE